MSIEACLSSYKEFEFSLDEARRRRNLSLFYLTQTYLITQ